MQLLTLALWGCLPYAMAGTPDAGLSTQVDGSVVLHPATGTAATPLEPFTRLGVGDRVVLAPAATLELVYYEPSRRESWLGPAEFVVRAAAPEVRSGTAQSVQPIDPALGEQLQSLPLLIQRAERAGNATRGQDKGPDPRSLLDAEELAAVEAAQKRFEGMREAWPHQDPLPYIYYAAVLEQYGLDAESNAILREARARCPLCDLPALSSEE